MAACRILIPARCEDACCGVARVAPATATAAASSSGFYGKSVRIGGRSAADLHRRAGLWRSLAVAEKVIVDGVVKAEEKVANAAAAVEEPAIEEEPVSLAAAEVKSFLADVSNLVKLVDSKDIVELELKNKNYEIIIRKAEALAPPPSAAPPVAAAPLPYSMFAPPAFGPMAAPAPAAAAAPAPAAAEAAEAPQAAPAAPQFPPMLSPMAGNFYRSPGPGEPAFVKVGDKVRKGQALCIIEAMKLMNSIESDQDGTIVEIIAEDGKPVSADDPLFVIKP